MAAAAAVMMMAKERKLSAASVAKVVPQYTIQGTVSVVDLTQRSFTLEPESPYIFENMGVDGVLKKSAVFLNVNNKEAKIVECEKAFSIPHCIDVGAIITLRNGRDKIEIKTSFEEDDGNRCIKVESLKTVK